MTFFDLNTDTQDRRDRKSTRYQQVIEEQVAISYASKGISFADTDMMCPYERKIVLDTISKIKEKEREDIEEATNIKNIPTKR